MNIGRMICLLRTAEGLSQVELANELGISRAYLSQIENGHKQPSLPFMRKAAAFFQIPLAVLLADENEADSEMMAMLRKMLGDALSLKMTMAENRKKSRKSRKKEKLKA